MRAPLGTPINSKRYYKTAALQPGAQVLGRRRKERDRGSVRRKKSVPHVALLVFRRIHKLHKANGPCYTAQGTSRCFCCFCCFCRKLSAVDIAFSAEILGRRRFGEHKNSGVRCSFAVLSLFFRCFGWKKSKNRKRGIPAGDRFIAPSDRLRIAATISQQRVIAVNERVASTLAATCSQET